MSVRADEYFAIVPESVLYSDVSAQAIRTYAVLRRYADKNGKAHPSYKTLAEMGHCSVATVRRALDELLETGAVEKQPNYVEGRQTSNDYVVISSRRVLTGEQGGVPTDEQVPVVTGEQGKNQSQEEPEPTPSAPRKRDALFDAIRDVCDLDSGTLTKSEAKRIGVVAAELRGAGFTPEDYNAAMDELLRRAHNYHSRFPGAALTPMAISHNWSLIGAALPSAVSDDPLDYFEVEPIDEERLAEFAAAAKANPWKPAVSA